MKPKHQRLIFVAVSLIFLCSATLLVLRAFSENIVFFFSPGELAARPVADTQLIRIGGVVAAGSMRKEPDNRLVFTVTDGSAEMEVRFQGMPPGLFREGQGVIAEGYLQNGGYFKANRILTKHDEKYMPREIVDSLKKSGRWKEGEMP